MLSTEARNKQIRTRDIAVVLLGDIAVFLSFVMLGKTEHGIIQSNALIRTALPFAIVWLAISPWLGTYRISTLYNFRTTVWRIPLTWLLCGLIALVARAALTDRPLTLNFTLVAIVVQGALLISWRGVFMMVISYFSRP